PGSTSSVYRSCAGDGPTSSPASATTRPISSCRCGRSSTAKHGAGASVADRPPDEGASGAVDDLDDRTSGAETLPLLGASGAEGGVERVAGLEREVAERGRHGRHTEEGVRLDRSEHFGGEVEEAHVVQRDHAA